MHKIHRLFHKLSATCRSVERTVLQSLREMLGLDDIAVRQIGDRAGNTQYAVMRTGGQTQPLECSCEHAGRIFAQRAVLGKLRRRNRGVAHVLALSGILPLTRGKHAGTNVGGVLLLGLTSCGKRGVFDRLHSNLQVDSVEQRTGQTVQILLNGGLGAGTACSTVPAAFAGIHCSNELKTCRIRHLTGDTRDSNSAVLKRLTQSFEHITAELRKFIQKQHTRQTSRSITIIETPSSLNVKFDRISKAIPTGYYLPPWGRGNHPILPHHKAEG